MFDAGMRVSLGAPEGRGVSHCLGCLACGRAWGFPIAWAGGHRRAWGFPIAWVTTLFFNNVGQKGVGFPHCLGPTETEFMSCMRHVISSCMRHDVIALMHVMLMTCVCACVMSTCGHRRQMKDSSCK